MLEPALINIKTFYAIQVIGKYLYLPSLLSSGVFGKSIDKIMKGLVLLPVPRVLPTNLSRHGNDDINVIVNYKILAHDDDLQLDIIPVLPVIFPYQPQLWMEIARR